MAEKEQSYNLTEEEENKLISGEYRKVLRNGGFSSDKNAKIRIRKALDVARQAHDGVRRKTGEPYILHPIAVANIVVNEIGLGATSVVCALLHDVVEDSDFTIQDIRDLFGDTEARIIDGLTKIEGLFDMSVSLQAENYRKIILTLADDVRVVLIKLADRLHNMRTLSGMRRDKQWKIASETLYIYAPLAHRLGLFQIKSDLEDLALKYKSPNYYNEIESKLEKSSDVRQRFINQFILPIKRALDNENIQFEIQGRPKSIYSIYRKMRKKNIPFEEVYDVFAVRITLDTDYDNEKALCWRVYSLITDFYKPNPDRLRDWISTPKQNGYESLHTTVMSPTGKWVEVQIRSKRMDEVAEKGVAAHWKYKGHKISAENALEDWINRIREILEDPETDAIDFVDDFKLNLFAKEIFTFTPKGEIISLPHDSTALDFAFEIHSDLGNKCIGAKVNQKLVPISYKLKSGDQVEILTSKVQHPFATWLDFVVTAKAKSVIRTYLKQEKKDTIAQGKEEAKKMFADLKVEFNDENLTQLSINQQFSNLNDLYYSFGIGGINKTKIKRIKTWRGKLVAKQKNENSQSLEEIMEATRGNRKSSLVLGSNTSDLNYILASCCNPIPGDEVVGFIRRDGVIAIHRVNCVNTEKLLGNYAYRVVRTTWDPQKESIQFLAGIKISGIDRTGIINDITRVISNEMTVNMRSISFDSSDGVFTGNIMLFVHHTSHLKDLRTKLKALKGVLKVERVE